MVTRRRRAICRGLGGFRRWLCAGGGQDGHTHAAGQAVGRFRVGGSALGGVGRIRAAAGCDVPVPWVRQPGRGLRHRPHASVAVGHDPLLEGQIALPLVARLPVIQLGAAEVSAWRRRSAAVDRGPPASSVRAGISVCAQGGAPRRVVAIDAHSAREAATDAQSTHRTPVDRHATRRTRFSAAASSR